MRAKRGHLFAKKAPLLHGGTLHALYRLSDGTLYAIVQAGRLHFSGHIFDLAPKQAGLPK